jgi:DNA-binding XRE family transcriptional regulator
VSLMQTPEIIRRRRLELGLSQAELAAAVGLDSRQIRRYETGDSQPSLQGARALAERLGVTIDELAGGPPHFSGSWWCLWHTPDTTTPRAGGVVISHRGNRVEIAADPHAETIYAWHSELRVDGNDLLGWYVIDDTDTRSKGTLVLSLNSETLGGTWVRISLNGLATGSLALGRTPTSASVRLDTILAQKRKNQTEK